MLVELFMAPTRNSGNRITSGSCGQGDTITAAANPLAVRVRAN
jgi:hypothetical protein